MAVSPKDQRRLDEIKASGVAAPTEAMLDRPGVRELADHSWLLREQLAQYTEAVLEARPTLRQRIATKRMMHAAIAAKLAKDAAG